MQNLILITILAEKFLIIALIFLLLPLLLSSLATVRDELACLHRKANALVFDLESCADALLFA